MTHKPVFCVTCRWCSPMPETPPRGPASVSYFCTAPQVSGPLYDLVTGDELPRGMHHCAVQRRPHLGMCGPLGTLWEAKP